MRPFIRVGGVAIALLVGAWFALGAHQTHELDNASALIDRAPTIGAAAGARAASALDAASRLNPDRAVELERSSLALHEGDAARARALALDVARAEPRNVAAWVAYGAASANDRVAFLDAVRHGLALAPPIKPSG